MKKLLLTLTALTTTGLGLAAVANATTKDGFYLRPSAEAIFVDKQFTKNVASVGVGGGGGLALGYQVGGFQFDLEAAYHYYGGTGTTNQTTGKNGLAMLGLIGQYQEQYRSTLTARLQAGDSMQEAQQEAQLQAIQSVTGAFSNLAAVQGGSTAVPVTTTVKNTEGFIPITLGLNYVIPLGTNSLTLTPGIAGGVFIHTVSRDITTVITVPPAQQGGNPTTSTTKTKDEATEYKGVVVPRLSLDWNISDSASLSLVGKIYIVPGGYSDNYSEEARASAALAHRVAPDTLTPTPQNFAQYFGALALTPAYNLQDQLFWYGGLNLAFQYTF